MKRILLRLFVLFVGNAEPFVVGFKTGNGRNAGPKGDQKLLHRLFDVGKQSWRMSKSWKAPKEQERIKVWLKSEKQNAPDKNSRKQDC